MHDQQNVKKVQENLPSLTTLEEEEKQTDHVKAGVAREV